MRFVVMAFGLAWMVVWGYWAVCRPSFREASIINATAPGFQMFWAALIGKKSALMLVPVCAVPLAAFVYFILARRSRNRSLPGRVA